jgi:centromere protein C
MDSERAPETVASRSNEPATVWYSTVRRTKLPRELNNESLLTNTMAKRKALIAVERQKTVPMTSNNTASTSLRGRRTGVIFSSQDDAPLRVDSDGMENADAFFESARTPPAIAVTRKEKENRPQKHLRFSLDSHGTSGSHGFFDKGALRRSQATRRREQWSPSELSKVSTAPPSVDRTREAAVLEEDVEQTRKGDDLDDEEGADAVFENRHAPGSPGANDLVVTNDPFDDDGDDMIPDPPPDSPTPDDDLTQEDDHMEAPTQNESDFPVDMDDDDDLVDDDNEGDGFQMAGSPVPETPDNALTERRLVEEKRFEEKRLKKKRKEEIKLAAMKAFNAANKSSSEADSDDQDAKTPKRKTKGQKKKTSRNAVFSPKGIPTGPREYNAVPVSELKQSPPAEAKKWRRSRRARTKPLDFWKNERIVYGPNDFDDDEYVGVKNMPVPIAFSLAQPTPYKKRKAPVWIDSDKAIALKKHRVAESSAVSIEEEPFDSSKLRKKYDYMNGQDANLWDDGTHEQVFTSTFFWSDTQRNIVVF